MASKPLLEVGMHKVCIKNPFRRREVLSQPHKRESTILYYNGNVNVTH